MMECRSDEGDFFSLFVVRGRAHHSSFSACLTTVGLLTLTKPMFFAHPFLLNVKTITVITSSKVKIQKIQQQ